MKYKLLTDPGHGWLSVRRSELYDLGIASLISSYSYQKGNRVYLEEDCDLNIFIQAKKGHNEPFEIVEQHTNRNHWIRGLCPYST